MADGEITGTVKIDGVAAQRQLIGISYAPQELEGEDEPRRIVVGETTSAEDGSYTLETPGFIDEVIVLALDNYGEIWRPNRAYGVGDRVRPTRGNETGYGYDITIAGTSGTEEPTWWVPAGGSDTGSIGAATAQAKQLWWSVAHAPILPTPSEVAPFDLHWESVSLLLQFEGENASKIFVDSSNNNLTITDFGDAQISTTNSKFGGSSGLFDGAGDYLAVPGIADFALASGDKKFTVECWARPTGSNQMIVFARGSATITWATGNLEWLIYVNPTNQLEIQMRNGATTPASYKGGTISLAGVWQHLAVSSDGTTVRGFINGVQVFSGPMSAIYAATASPSLEVGRLGSAGLGYSGMLHDLRITKGVARYTDVFTPPADQFPTVGP